MNNNRRRSSKNKESILKNKITRCKSKMIPVFESDTCEFFIKKENSDSNKICRNCEHSF